MVRSGDEKQTKRKILIVDDESFVRELLSEYYGKLGYVTLAAGGGKAGWKEYERSKPDIVITDLKMADMSGIELLNLIRSKDAITPVVILTGYPNSESAAAAFSLGVSEYFIKPFNLNELRLAVERLTGSQPESLKEERMEAYIRFLRKRNRELEGRIAELSAGSGNATRLSERDRFKSVIGAFAHGLKGEFLHISEGMRTLKGLGLTELAVIQDVEFVDRSAEYAQLLLRRLLGYFDLAQTRPEPLDITTVLGNVEGLTRPRLPERITLDMGPAYEADDLIATADRDELTLVILELIDNARTAIADKRGVIQLRAGRDGEHITICVSDNGPGIPKEIKKRVLIKEVPSKRGLGLGLYLSNKLIAAMGGKLEVTSSSKAGSTVCIRLPADKGRR